MLSSTTSAVTRHPAPPGDAPLRSVPGAVVPLAGRRAPGPERHDQELRVTRELLAALVGVAPRD